LYPAFYLTYMFLRFYVAFHLAFYLTYFWFSLIIYIYNNNIYTYVLKRMYITYK
jgi:hypothetical protein